MDAVVDWTKRSVACAECGARLARRLFRPKDHKRIERFFCDHQCKGAWQKRQHPVSNEWLYQKYIAEGLSAVDIAVIVGRDPKSIWTWLRNAGIETRPRGSDERQHFRKGDPSPFLGRSHSEETKDIIRQARIREGRFPLDGKDPYWKGKVGPRHPSWKGGLTPERQAFYCSEEWKNACKTVWHRADAKCERCGIDSRDFRPKERRFAIHHIVSFQVRELRAVPSNLVLLCADCHRFVHSKRNTKKELLA